MIYICYLLKLFVVLKDACPFLFLPFVTIESFNTCYDNVHRCPDSANLKMDKIPTPIPLGVRSGQGMRLPPHIPRILVGREHGMALAVCRPIND